MAEKKWVGGFASNETNVNHSSNYSPTGVPIAGDNLFVEANPSGTDYSMITGLTAFQAITLASFNVASSYTGTIGLTTAGSSSYLGLGGTNSSAITVNIGYSSGNTVASSGAPLVKLDLGSMRGTVNVTSTNQSSLLESGGPVALLGTHTSNTLNLINGIVSIAADPLEVSNFRTINTSGTLFMGTGCTTSFPNVYGGVSTIQSGVGTLTMTGGTVNFIGSGTLGLGTLTGGRLNYLSTGTATTISAQNSTVDFSGDSRAKTVTTINLNNSSLNISNGVKNSITITNPITTIGSCPITAWPNSSYVIS
jgi:hypothetical protein